MERVFRIALLVGAAFSMPLPAVAQTLRTAAPLAAPFGLPLVPATLPAAGPGSGLAFPTLPGAASLPLLALPAPAALSLPAPAAAPRLAAVQTARPATAVRQAPQAVGYAPAATRRADPLASLQAAQTLPRLTFDGGQTGNIAADAVAAGPGPAFAGRPGLSRLAGSAPRAVVAAVPAPRPSALKRLRDGSWGVVVGFTMLGAGAALMLTPGPGTPFILLGLYLLSGRFAWARQGLDKIRSIVKRRVFHGSENRMEKLERRLGM